MSKNARGFEKVSPKLVKLAAIILVGPLTKTVNNSISKGVLPNEVKFHLVSPLNKKHKIKILF